MCIKHPHRETTLSRHHILNKIRGGTMCPKNILRLWRDKHNCWHYIFKDRTIDEIMYTMSTYYDHYSQTDEWRVLFKDLPLLQIVRLLERTMKIKRSLKRYRGK